MTTKIKVTVAGASADEVRRVEEALSREGLPFQIGPAGDGTGAAAGAESDLRFRALIENASDMIAVLDSEARLTYVTPAFEKLLGFRPEELLGRVGFEFVHPADRDEVVRAFQRIVEGGERATVRIEYRFRHRDGSWRNLESIGTNLLQEPAVRGIVVNSRDVSDRKRVESQLEQAQRHASLGRLAAMVAHEFNNVLMGIQPFAEIVQRHAGSDPSLHQAAEHIQASVRRGRSITQEILLFTRPRETKLSEIDLGPWLESIRPELASILAPEQSLTIETKATLTVRADEGQLAQVLVNLVHNARDAMGPAGTVRIEAGPAEALAGSGVATQDEGLASITVRDEGSGIGPDTLPQIFDPLFTTKRGAAGLGLANARLMIEKMGGKILVESEPGAGSSFHVLVPRASGDSATASPSARPTPSPDGNRLLLVEDDPNVGPGMVSLLEMEGFSTMLVDTGAECVPAVRSFHPDLVVLDVGLPDVDGLAVYRDLMSEWPALPVILSTGHGDRGRIDQVPRGAKFGFLQKPYPIEDLLALIGKLSGRG